MTEALALKHISLFGDADDAVDCTTKNADVLECRLEFTK